ncbi:uncharacterized protein LOC120194297 [Hibiscus syriacus]|uniref:uncharacterized protein LOC120194297 n=1 Tax=Hibiscus syriacus TaxID=106335 RepID=UPI001922A031|nr:uncharacterized protein LOC120194297 [Hibiscus syriacus]
MVGLYRALIHHSIISASPPVMPISSLVTDSGNRDLNRIEQLVPEHICYKIADVCPPNSAFGEEKPGWRWELNHNFTIRSVYKVLLSSMPNDNGVHWSNVWSLNVLQRIRTFLWLVVHGRLLTNDERFMRHMATSNSCELCHNEVEDIWKRRCSILLQPNNVDKVNLLLECFQLKNEIIASRGNEDGHHRLQRQVTWWQKPPVGWVKGNSDGAMDCLSKMATAGGL